MGVLYLRGKTRKMPKSQNFYQDNLKKFQAELAVKKKQLAVSSTVRLLVFVALCVLIYFLWGNFQFVAISVVTGIAAFLFLVSRHSDLRYKADFLKQLLALNEVELQVLNRKFPKLMYASKKAMTLNHCSTSLACCEIHCSMR